MGIFYGEVGGVRLWVGPRFSFSFLFFSFIFFFRRVWVF